jgi:hypothetical protein
MLLFPLLIASIGYVLIPIAFVFMLKNYKTKDWIWAILLVPSVFIGIGPFIALAYLVTLCYNEYRRHSNRPVVDRVVYNRDGSYTVYKADSVKSVSPAQSVFKIIGWVIAGIFIVYGLLFVGLMIFMSIACSGNSKCM